MSLPVARSRGPARLGLCNSTQSWDSVIFSSNMKLKNWIEFINNHASYSGFKHIVISAFLTNYYWQKKSRILRPLFPDIGEWQGGWVSAQSGGSCDSTFPLCDWPPWPESGSLIGGHESRYSPNTVQFAVCCLLSISPAWRNSGSTDKTLSRQASSSNFRKAFALVNT